MVGQDSISIAHLRHERIGDLAGHDEDKDVVWPCETVTNKVVVLGQRSPRQRSLLNMTMRN